MPQSKENLLCNLAHELRQPLSTIESIAYYLELALPHAEPRVLEQLTRLRHLVAQSGWILSDSLALSDVPAPRPEVIDLDEMLSEFVLEQMHHDACRVHFNLELSGAPAWMDYQQGRDLVHGICRFFGTVAKPGAEIYVATTVLADGGILLRAHAEGSTGDDANLPAGANLTIECIENIVARNSGSIFIRLSDPSRLEMAVEVPAAPLERALLPELDEALPSFEEVELPEQVAPGIL